jgi:lipopolysaccharide biosynthesis protein
LIQNGGAGTLPLTNVQPKCASTLGYDECFAKPLFYQEDGMTLRRRVHRYCRKALSLLHAPNPYRTRTAVLVHVYYHDLWDELAAYIANLRPLPFDLYVNVVDDGPASLALSAGIRRRFLGAFVQTSENRGHDIGGALRSIDRVLKSGRAYDALIFIHTKKSVRQPPGYGDSWRERLLSSILGTPTRAVEIAREFMIDPYLGMVAANDFVWSAANLGDLAYRTNKPLIDEYCQRLGVKMVNTQFVAGTMFWVRASPFLKVFQEHDPLALAAELPQGASNDEKQPQRPHALERVFSFIMTGQGYYIRGMPNLEPLRRSA